MESTVETSWNQLYAKSDKMRVPEGAVLTKNTIYGRERPEPEVVEHLLDHLETKMRNYLVLYNRERELRQKAEDNAYRLEKEIVEYQHKLEAAGSKLQCLENKIQSMVEQPTKLRDTIDKIDLLYTQMDTLIQAFVGIGSCAVIQGYSRIAFIKLCLEYLYPCRELDVRLNSLYTALYSVLIQCGNVDIMCNEIMRPLPLVNEETPAPLIGLNIKIHRLLLRCDLPSPEPTSYTCKFRYDHQDKNQIPDKFSITIPVKPLDNAAKVIEFDSAIEADTLPPKVPNVIPKLVVDVYANDFFIGTAETSIISSKTLKPMEPWSVTDNNGFHCGDVIITLSPLPKSAKLPASNFKHEVKTSARAEVETNESDKAKVVPDVKKDDLKPAAPIEPETEPTPPTSTQAPPFEPKKNTNFRRPLLFNKTPPNNTQKPVTNNKPKENVSKLTEKFDKRNADNKEKLPKDLHITKAAEVTLKVQNDKDVSQEREEVASSPIKSAPPAIIEPPKDHTKKEEGKDKDDVVKQDLNNEEFKDDGKGKKEDKGKDKGDLVEMVEEVKEEEKHKEGSVKEVKDENKDSVKDDVIEDKSANNKEMPKNISENKTEVKDVPVKVTAPVKGGNPPKTPVVPKAKLPVVTPKLQASPKVEPVPAPAATPPPKADAPLPAKPLIPIVIAPKLLKKPPPKK